MDKSEFREELEDIKEVQGELDERIQTLESSLDEEPEAEPEPKEAVEPEPKDKETTTIDPIKWLGRVGILITVLGVGFFIAYAIEIGLIGYLARILIGAGAGMLLVGLGHYLYTKEQDVFSQILSTGGFIITYFSIFSSYFFDEYREAIGTTLGITSGLLGITILSMILYMVSYGSSVTTGLGLLLGYITTFLSGPSTFAPLIYLALLTLAGLYVTKKKQWITPLIVSTVSTYLFAFNAVNLDSFYTIPFAVLVTLYLLIKATTLQVVQDYKYPILASLNSLFFLGFTRIQLVDDPSLKFFILGLAALHFLIYLFYTESMIQYTSLSTSLAFLLLYSVIDLSGIILTVTWIGLAIALTYTYTKKSKLIYLILSYFFAALSFFKAALYDWILNTDTVLNGLVQESSIMIAITITGYLILSYLHTHHGHKKAFMTGSVILFLVMLLTDLEGLYLLNAIAGSAILLRLIQFDKIDIVTRIASYVYIPVAAIQGFTLLPWETTRLVSNEALSMTFVSAVLVGFAKEETKTWVSKVLGTTSLGIFLLTIALDLANIYITIGWGLLGLLLTAYGVSQEQDWTRKLGLFTFVITVLKLFLYDTQGLSNLYKTIAYIALGVMLLLSAYVYSRYRKSDE